ncbi:hypothetical protein ACQKIC_16140 [Peribacillus sp. NPDC046944]
MREQVFRDMNKILDKVKYFEEIERKRDKNFSTIVLLDNLGVVWDAEFLDFFLHEFNYEESWITYRAIFKVEIRIRKKIN